MRLGLISSLLLVILAVIFASLNTKSMGVNLLFFQTSGSKALILILTFGLGVLVGLLSTLPKQFRMRSKLKDLQKKQSSGSEPSSSPTTSESSGSSGTGGTGSTTG